MLKFRPGFKAKPTICCQMCQTFRRTSFRESSCLPFPLCLQTPRRWMVVLKEKTKATSVNRPIHASTIKLFILPRNRAFRDKLVCGWKTSRTAEMKTSRAAPATKTNERRWAASMLICPSSVWHRAMPGVFMGIYEVNKPVGQTNISSDCLNSYFRSSVSCASSFFLFFLKKK